MWFTTVHVYCPHETVRNVSVLRRTSRSLGLYRRFRRSSRPTSPCLDDTSQTSKLQQ
ncbi:hypothetical protein EXIGLDRAFT_716523 [Exidia glandulosa HHB12029]|uniref:Uncharacterized protein n=1 Tax=Exidia glandulosa HHB12029 TaxID=1314781 RepID=A0A165PAE0_EXIGL|nr:hypothetical protein EXIGLDRAFT_716523 [Exidia glandulosa HHB12029]